MVVVDLFHLQLHTISLQDYSVTRSLTSSRRCTPQYCSNKTISYQQYCS